MSVIEYLRSKGYPMKIKGNGGYTAVLVNIQPLLHGDFMAIYRYPGGECCHDLKSIMGTPGFEIIQQ